MLAKQYRLTKKKDFEAISKAGRASFGPYFFVKFIPNEKANSRFGLIVSNKVSKKASQRNLIKRRLREILRLQRLKIAMGYDMVIIVSPKIIQTNKVLKYNLIEESLLTILRKAKLL